MSQAGSKLQSWASSGQLPPSLLREGIGYPHLPSSPAQPHSHYSLLLERLDRSL